jgi:hypothetical protein
MSALAGLGLGLGLGLGVLSRGLPLYLVPPLTTFGCRAYRQPEGLPLEGHEPGYGHGQIRDHARALSRRCERTTSIPRAAASSTMAAYPGEQVRANPLANQTFANPAPHGAREVPGPPVRALANGRV